MNTSPSKHGELPSGGLNDDELAQLDTLLETLDPEESMTLSELDGFCAALACCPEVIPLIEWLPAVVGPAAGRAEAAPGLVEVGRLAERHRRSVWVMLDAGQVFSPVVMVDEEGMPDPGVWANGFVRAMALRPHLWSDDLVDENVSDALDCIIGLAAAAQEAGVASPEGAAGEGPEPRHEAMQMLVDSARASYEGLAEARRRMQAPVTLRYAERRPGRNDVCRCGSGLKFKRCCGGKTD